MTHSDCLGQADRIDAEETAASDKRSKASGQPSSIGRRGRVLQLGRWVLVVRLAGVERGSRRVGEDKLVAAMACQSWDYSQTALKGPKSWKVEDITTSGERTAEPSHKRARPDQTEPGCSLAGDNSHTPSKQAQGFDCRVLSLVRLLAAR